MHPASALTDELEAPLPIVNPVRPVVVVPAVDVACGVLVAAATVEAPEVVAVSTGAGALKQPVEVSTANMRWDARMGTIYAVADHPQTRSPARLHLVPLRSLVLALLLSAGCGASAPPFCNYTHNAGPCFALVVCRCLDGSSADYPACGGEGAAKNCTEACCAHGGASP